MTFPYTRMRRMRKKWFFLAAWLREHRLTADDLILPYVYAHSRTAPHAPHTRSRMPILSMPNIERVFLSTLSLSSKANRKLARQDGRAVIPTTRINSLLLQAEILILTRRRVFITLNGRWFRRAVSQVRPSTTRSLLLWSFRARPRNPPHSSLPSRTRSLTLISREWAQRRLAILMTPGVCS